LATGPTGRVMAGDREVIPTRWLTGRAGLRLAAEEVADRGDALPDCAFAEVPEAEDELRRDYCPLEAVVAHAEQADGALPRR
jgi:hypothetical protein